MENRKLNLEGRILYLTKDTDLIKRQLAGEDIEINNWDELIDNVSTDEITPARTCYYYDSKLGDFCLVGLRENAIGINSIKDAGIDVIVSGYSKGCGSSRETAPYSELFAGVKLVIARSFEKIYRQNCENIGLFTTTDFSYIQKIKEKGYIDIEDLMKSEDALSREIILTGGLLKYARQSKLREYSRVVTPKDKPMTIVSKIIKSHLVAPQGAELTDISAENSVVWVDVDAKFSHDYVTPMAEYIYKREFGESAEISNKENTYFFRDHLNLLDEILTQEELNGDTWKQAKTLHVLQADFSKKQGIKCHDGTAICHMGMIESYVLPSQIVIGTDSHSCTEGVLGSLSFGVGSTDMVNAWYTNKVRVKVPKSIRVEIVGTPQFNITAKDIMLKLLSDDFIKQGKAIGTCIEFYGNIVENMEIEERATLTNMAVEAGAMTGIIAVDEKTIKYLEKHRGITREEILKNAVYSDENAEYLRKITLDVTNLKPLVALPGDPHNVIPICELKETINIDIAYGGACTGGKITDMDMYAETVKKALTRGKKIAEDVTCYLQCASEDVKRYVERMKYDKLFESIGIILLPPSCGACINAGPGVSTSKEQVTISSINRNFIGRSGPGQMYLASPWTVIASAVAGYITEEF